MILRAIQKLDLPRFHLTIQAIYFEVLDMYITHGEKFLHVDWASVASHSSKGLVRRSHEYVVIYTFLYKMSSLDSFAIT